MPSKWRASFIGLLLLGMGGAALFFYFRAPAPSPSALESVAPASSAANATSTNTAAFPSAPPMKRVMDLYESESQRVGKVDPDPALTEKRLTAAAKDLTADEIAWLGEQALDRAGEMDARFFATYLAALSRSEASVATLHKIATTPIPVSKNEMRMQEERALRMQAIEGLSRNCPLASAKDALLDIVGVEDEGVRDLAHRALYACHTGKKIEDPVKAGLERLQKGAK